MLILRVRANYTLRVNSRSSTNLEFSKLFSFFSFSNATSDGFIYSETYLYENIRHSLESSAQYASNESSPISLGHSVQALTSDETG